MVHRATACQYFGHLLRNSERFCGSVLRTRLIATSSESERMQDKQWLFNDGQFFLPPVLVDLLCQCVISQTESTVVCYKPYGVSTFGERPESSAKEQDFTSYMRSSTSKSASISSVLPTLAQAFNCKTLHIAKTVPRYASGIIVFAKSEKQLNFVRRSCAFAVNELFPYISCWTLCVGAPYPVNGIYHMSTAKRIYNNKALAVEIPEPSNRQIKNNLVHRGVVAYKTLAQCQSISLVELRTTTFAGDVPRVLLMKVGAPILGDAIYQQRVAQILGRIVLVDPKSCSVKNQPVPADILNALQVTPNEYYALPMFLHNFGMLLRRYPMPQQETQFSCELPPRFAKALDVFGLEHPEVQTEFDVKEYEPL